MISNKPDPRSPITTRRPVRAPSNERLSVLVNQRVERRPRSRMVNAGADGASHTSRPALGARLWGGLMTMMGGGLLLLAGIAWLGRKLFSYTSEGILALLIGLAWLGRHGFTLLLAGGGALVAGSLWLAHNGAASLVWLVRSTTAFLVWLVRSSTAFIISLFTGDPPPQPEESEENDHPPAHEEENGEEYGEEGEEYEEEYEEEEFYTDGERIEPTLEEEICDSWQEEESTSPPTRAFEQHKMAHLAQEEESVDPELLVDQAASLRSRVVEQQGKS